MKLMIEIPEEDYIRLRDEGMFGNVTTFKRAVREGIPLDQEPCEMTAEEYRQRMIQAFHNADCDELIALVVLPTEKEFEHLGWLLEKHYKAKPEPCTDAISRDKAIVQLSHLLSDWDDDWNVAIRKCIETIKIVPPVTPAEKVGHWIFDKILDKHYYCSECKSMGVDYWDYCPNCGAKMEVD